MTPAALCLGHEFSDKMHKFLRSQAEYLVALAFLCCHYIFGSYVTCLTLSSNFLCIYSLEQQLFQPFKSFLYQSRCSLEPKNFLKGLRPLNPLPRGLDCLSAPLMLAFPFFLLSNLAPIWFFLCTSWATARG